MSMERCEKCSRQIDTDKDVECYVYVGNMRRLHATITLCEPCRIEREAEEDARDAQASWAEYQAEQQEKSHA